MQQQLDNNSNCYKSVTQFSSPHSSNVLPEILQLLSDIEQEHHVKILYVCDAGSRAMSIHDQSESDSSDYDVRFVYVHPVNWYLRVRDEIDLEIRKKVMIKLEHLQGDETEIDFVGYEFRKMLSYTAKSNPTAMEWMVQSEIIYYCYDEEWLKEMKEFWNVYYFNLKTIVYHYLNIAKDNYVDYLRNKPEVNRKKYIYILRCLLWVEHAKLSHFSAYWNAGGEEEEELKKKITPTIPVPPFNMNQLISETLLKQQEYLNHPEKNKYPIPFNIFEKQTQALEQLNYLIDRKKNSSGQWTKQSRIPVLDDWLMFLRMEEKVFADKILSVEKRKIDCISQEEKDKLQQRFDTLFYQHVMGFDKIPSICFKQ